MSKELKVGLKIEAKTSGIDNVEKVNEQVGGLNNKVDELSKKKLGNGLRDKLETAKTSAIGLKTALVGAVAALGSLFAVSKVAGFFKGAITGAANLEEQLDKVKAVSGATDAEMAKIATTAKELGASTRYTATEAAEGFEILSRAGLDANQSIATLPSVLALAQGASLELSEAAGYVTKAIAGFNLEATDSGRVADVLAKGAASANTNVEGLGAALSYAAPSAAALGLSLEDTVAMIGKFADAGIDASRAGTALNSILSQFSNPASTFRKELSAIGITSNDFNVALRELADSGDKGSKAIIAVGQEAGPALKSMLAQGMPALDELAGKLRNAGGSAKEMASTMDGNLFGALRGLGSAWDSVKTTLGEPILEPITEQINRLSGIVRDFVTSGEIKKLGDYFAKTFGDMAKSVVDFVQNFTLDDTTNKVSEFADSVTSRFNKVGAAFSLVYNTLATGFNTIKATILGAGAVVTKVISSIIGGFAELVDIIPGLNDTAESIRNVADGLEAVADAYRNEAKSALEDAERNIEGIHKATDTLTQSTEQNTKAVDANKAAIDAKNKAMAAEIAAFNAKTARLNELKALEDSYRSQSVRDDKRLIEIAAERMALEDELAEKAKDKTLTVIESAQAVTAASEKSAKVTKQMAKESSEALEAVGLSLDQLRTGMSDSERAIVDGMGTATQYINATAKSSKEAGEMMERYLVAAADKIKTPEGMQAFIDNLKKLKIETEAALDAEQIGAEQYKARIELINGSIDGMQDSLNKATPAWNELHAAIKKATDTQAIVALREETKKLYEAGELSAEQYKQTLKDLSDQQEAVNKAGIKELADNTQKRYQSAEVTRDQTEATKELTAARIDEAAATQKAASAEKGRMEIGMASDSIRRETVTSSQQLYDTEGLTEEQKKWMAEKARGYNEVGQLKHRMGFDVDFRQQLQEFADDFRRQNKRDPAPDIDREVKDVFNSMPTPTLKIETKQLAKSIAQHIGEREAQLTKQITKQVTDSLTADIQKTLKGRG